MLRGSDEVFVEKLKYCGRDSDNAFDYADLWITPIICVPLDNNLQIKTTTGFIESPINLHQYERKKYSLRDRALLISIK